MSSAQVLAARRERHQQITLPRRARHRLRTRFTEYPSLYLPFARRKYPGPSPEVISSATELVIDGYTRCASTFAVYAFQLAQPAPVRLAHHLHAPAQLAAAARARVPALAVIREPRGALLSQLIREPDVALRDALIAYARFYERLLPHRGRLVAADFEEVTKDFGAVTRRVNDRFGTGFAEFEPSEQNTQRCFELIKLRSTLSPVLLGFESGTVTSEDLLSEFAALTRQRQAQAAGAAGLAAETWVPSAERERSKAALREQWEQPALALLRDRAQWVYDEFRRPQ
jgi:hypothetical protein